MTYEDKYQELVELSRSDNPIIREQSDAWLVSIGLQDAAELKVSTFLLDLAVSNVKGEISRDEVSQRLRERYGDNLYEEPKTGLDGDVRWILQSGIKIAGFFQVKQTSHLFTGTILKCRALVDWKHSGFSISRLITGLNTFCFNSVITHLVVLL